MTPDFQSALVLAPRTDTGVGCGLACGTGGPQVVPVFTYAPSPRGEYLRAVREALGIHTGNAARILKIGIADVSGLETGRIVFAESSTWARVELALINSQRPVWGGWAAHDDLFVAASIIVAVARSHHRDRAMGVDEFYESAQIVACAAKLQHNTVKRGILYRLAGALALEAGQRAEAEQLARVGLSCEWSIGAMPPWLTAGLRAVLVAEPAVEPA